MATKSKVGRMAKGGALWKGAKWVSRKVWPKVEKRLASKNKGFFEKVLRRTRRQPA